MVGAVRVYGGRALIANQILCYSDYALGRKIYSVCKFMPTSARLYKAADHVVRTLRRYQEASQRVGVAKTGPARVRSCNRHLLNVFLHETRPYFIKHHATEYGTTGMDLRRSALAFSGRIR
jgi:hypothetical protein